MCIELHCWFVRRPAGDLSLILDYLKYTEVGIKSPAHALTLTSERDPSFTCGALSDRVLAFRTFDADLRTGAHAGLLAERKAYSYLRVPLDQGGMADVYPRRRIFLPQDQLKRGHGDM